MIMTKKLYGEYVTRQKEKNKDRRYYRRRELPIRSRAFLNVMFVINMSILGFTLFVGYFTYIW